MEKEIKIKDLINSVLDKWKIFAIVASSLSLVFCVLLLVIGMNTKVYTTQIELSWDNSENFRYPDNTGISRDNFVDEDALIIASQEAGIKIDTENIYSDESIKLSYIKSELLFENHYSPLYLDIELDIDGLGITEEKAEVFIESLRMQYLSLVAKKAERYNTSVNGYNPDINELIVGYDVFRDSLSNLLLNLQVVNNNNQGFSYDGKDVIYYNYEINKLNYELEVASELMVSTEGTKNIIYTNLKDEEALRYINSLGFSEKERLEKLEEELSVLEKYCNAGTVTEICLPDTIYNLKVEIITLEDKVEKYYLLSDILNDEITEYEFRSIDENIKNEFSDLKDKIEEQKVDIENFIYEYNLEYLIVEFTMPNVYNVDQFGGILFYALALIAAVGIPVVCIWIFEDWDKRIS